MAIDWEVREEINKLAIENILTPAQIFHKIKEDPRFLTKTMPVVRTVERQVEKERVKDLSGPWSISDWDGTDARLVLDVLGAMTNKRSMTKSEAEWVVRISKLAPGLDVHRIWFLAATYRTREAKELDTGELDSYLAFKPWESTEKLSRYKKAVELGQIQATTMWYDLVESRPPGQPWKFDLDVPMQPFLDVREDTPHYEIDPTYQDGDSIYWRRNPDGTQEFIGDDLEEGESLLPEIE